MGRFFKNKPRAGKPISLRGLAEGLAKIERALDEMTIEDGQVVWSVGDVPHLIVGDGEGDLTPEMLERIKDYVGGGVEWPTELLSNPAKYVLCKDNDGEIGWVATCSHASQHPEVS